ncbi:MAG: nucleoside-diphosphate kinase, partial [Patescibacteria group bacterium]
MIHDNGETLVLIKPDAVARGHADLIISRYEQVGLRVLRSMRISSLSRELAEKLYAEHKGRDFYDGLIAFMTRGTIVALHLTGPIGIVEQVR